MSRYLKNQLKRSSQKAESALVALLNENLNDKFTHRLSEVEALQFLNLVEGHNLEGILPSHFSQNLPHYIQQRIQKRKIYQRSYNQFLYDQSKQLNLILNNFNPIFLKGIGLLGNVYHDFEVRNIADIDILVSQKTSREVENHLIKFGYKLLPQVNWMGNKHKQNFRLDIGDFSVFLEIHTSLICFDRSQKLLTRKNEFSKLTTLSIEYQFYHLILHLGFQHNYTNLKWLLDIHLLKRKYEFDLEFLLHLFKKSNRYRSLIQFNEIYHAIYKEPFLSQIPRRNLYFPKSLQKFLIYPHKYKTLYAQLKLIEKGIGLESTLFSIDWLKQKSMIFFHKNP